MKRFLRLYCPQALVGGLVATSGAFEIGGQGAMARLGELIGLHSTLTLIAGSAQFLAGLCLLLPGGAVPATVLLIGLTVCSLGVFAGYSRLLDPVLGQVPRFGCAERDASERGANALPPHLRTGPRSREHSI